VVLYADGSSPGMAAAIEETARRRERQFAFNTAHGIVPRTAHKVGSLGGTFAEQLSGRKAAEAGVVYRADGEVKTAVDLPDLTRRMIEAAENLRFEEAARLRDVIKAIEAGGEGHDGAAVSDKPARGGKPRRRGARR
jgi:excinuclease ABC subunit B